MRSINKVILVGNLTRDPELRQTPNGQSVCTFGIATNREWVTKDRERKSSAEFHECVAWAHLAEICASQLKKGKLVYVEGYLKTRNWETPEGLRKFKTEIIVQDMIILEKRSKSDDDDFQSYNHDDDSYQQDDEEEIGASAEASELTQNDSTSFDESPSEEAFAPSNTDSEDEDPINKDLGL